MVGLCPCPFPLVLRHATQRAQRSLPPATPDQGAGTWRLQPQTAHLVPKGPKRPQHSREAEPLFRHPLSRAGELGAPGANSEIRARESVGEMAGGRAGAET